MFHYGEWETGYPDEIIKIKIDPKGKMVRFKAFDNYAFVVGDVIRVRDACACLEDFPPGRTFKWFFPEPEVQYILGGKAEISYRLARDLLGQTKKFIAEAGDCYLIPRGAYVEFNVDASGPFRKFCVLMPGIAPRAGVERTEDVSDYSTP